MIIYTDAPVEYDYHYTVELDPAVGTLRNGRTVRKVDITDEYRGENYQIPRYASGLCIRLTQAEFDQWVADGLIVAT